MKTDVDKMNDLIIQREGESQFPVDVPDKDVGDFAKQLARDQAECYPSVKIGTTGYAVRTDYWYQPHASRELIIYEETKAYWKAKMNNEPNAEARWWFRKKDLVQYPKSVFPVKFKYN